MKLLNKRSFFKWKVDSTCWGLAVWTGNTWKYSKVILHVRYYIVMPVSSLQLVEYLFHPFTLRRCPPLVLCLCLDIWFHLCWMGAWNFVCCYPNLAGCVLTKWCLVFSTGSTLVICKWSVRSGLSSAGELLSLRFQNRVHAALEDQGGLDSC